MKKSKRKAIRVAAQARGFFEYDPFTKKILSCLALVFYDINFISPGTHKDHMGRPFMKSRKTSAFYLYEGIQ
jgi:hypothetical protein